MQPVDMEDEHVNGLLPLGVPIVVVVVETFVVEFFVVV
jgi:hypothetical protein